MTLAEIERNAILDALRAHDWHQGKAAEALDISERTIRNKIRRYRAEGFKVPAHRIGKLFHGEQNRQIFPGGAA